MYFSRFIFARFEAAYNCSWVVGRSLIVSSMLVSCRTGSGSDISRARALRLSFEAKACWKADI